MLSERRSLRLHREQPAIGKEGDNVSMVFTRALCSGQTAQRHKAMLIADVQVLSPVLSSKPLNRAQTPEKKEEKEERR